MYLTLFSFIFFLSQHTYSALIVLPIPPGCGGRRLSKHKHVWHKAEKTNLLLSYKGVDLTFCLTQNISLPSWMLTIWTQKQFALSAIVVWNTQLVTFLSVPWLKPKRKQDLKEGKVPWCLCQPNKLLLVVLLFTCTENYTSVHQSTINLW